jgi:hypothetical protein
MPTDTKPADWVLETPEPAKTQFQEISRPNEIRQRKILNEESCQVCGNKISNL